MKKCLIGLMLLAAVSSYAQTVEIIAGQSDFLELPIDQRLNVFEILGENGLLYGEFEGQFYEYDPESRQIRTLPSTVSDIDEVDERGNIYWYRDNRVFYYERASGIISVLLGNGEQGLSINDAIGTETSLGRIRDLIITPSRVYFMEDDFYIKYLDRQSNLIVELVSPNMAVSCEGDRGLGSFIFFDAMALDVNRGFLYVSDFNEGLFRIRLNEGNCLEAYQGSSPFAFKIALDANGKLYISESIDFFIVFIIDFDTQETSYRLPGSDILCTSALSVESNLAGDLLISYNFENKKVLFDGINTQILAEDWSDFGLIESFAQLSGLTIDQEDNVYLMDRGRGYVARIDDTTEASLFIANPPNTNSQYEECLANSQILDFDRATNSIVVSSIDRNNVDDSYYFTSFGVDDMVKQYNFGGYFTTPNDFAVSPKGTIVSVFGNVVEIGDDIIRVPSDRAYSNVVSNSEQMLLLGSIQRGSTFLPEIFSFDEMSGAIEPLNRSDDFLNEEFVADRRLSPEVRDLFLDENGDLYLSISRGIWRYSIVTRKLEKIVNSSATGDISSLISPGEIAVDSEGNLYVIDFGVRVLKISDLPVSEPPSPMMTFTLVNPRLDEDVRKLESLDYWFLRDLWRINIRADVNPVQEVGSVKFTVNGETSNIDNSWPYSAGGDTNGDYHVLPINNGVYTICGIPYSGRDASGTMGQMHCITLSLIFTLPDELQVSGVYQSKPGSYPSMKEAEGETEYAGLAQFNRDNRSFQGSATFDFPNADLAFRSTSLHHFYRRKIKTTLFWYGSIDGVDDFIMEQRFLERPRVTFFRTMIKRRSTGEIVYDSQIGDPQWARPTIEFTGSGSILNAMLPAQIDTELPFAEVEVSVLPNPFTDYLSVYVPESGESSTSLRLFDMNGRQVLESEVSTGTTTRLDTQILPRGIYVLQVPVDDGYAQFRVVK